MSTPSLTSFFESVTLLPEDPILGLTESFAKDKRTNKVNLGVGSYKNEEGAPLVLSAVKKAETILQQKNLNKEYLPIVGDTTYIQETLKLVFKNITPEMFGAQAVGGTGALRIGAEVLAEQKYKRIFLPAPTWGNHNRIFTRGGLAVENYPYYDSKKNGLNFIGMCQAVINMQRGDIILLHACCHNPTGIDLSTEQWGELSLLLKKHGVIPFFDLAYLGFGQGVNDDSKPLQIFLKDNHEMFISVSYSKNFGLYGERVGAFVFVGRDPQIAQKVGSHVKIIIRGNYSNPPSHGARIITTILQSELRKEWIEELDSMRQRIQKMRNTLVDGLHNAKCTKDCSYMKQQHGMFSFTGITAEQVQKLQNEYAIYMTSDGRINVAGLNKSNLDYVVNALKKVIDNE